MSEENNLQVSNQTTVVGNSEKKLGNCLLLFLFLGYLGAHRFYVGKVGTALLYIITLGGLGIWAIVDFILIVVGNFKDKEGKPVRR